METPVLTPHFFDFSYFILLILLAIILCALCFHDKSEGLIDRVSASLFFRRKSEEVRGKATSALRYCNIEDVKLLQGVQGLNVSRCLI
ncbi:hypothetical protein DS878_10555 [Marinobacter sp. F3R11]|nr:hypothetical protein DS878_10555 [Marinobacter sp. F3R11]